MAASKTGMTIGELMDSVQVKNRVCDGIVRITFDGKQVEWAPGEVKNLPRALAEWFQAKSLYLFNPGDINEGIPAKSHYKLAILGMGQDEDDLTKEGVNVPELLDAQNMPELTRVDPATGKPMRRVYIDPRSTGARDSSPKKALSKAMTKESAMALAQAAQTDLGGADKVEE